MGTGTFVYLILESRTSWIGITTGFADLSSSPMFWDMASLCSLDLKFTVQYRLAVLHVLHYESPVSSSWELGLQAWASTLIGLSSLLPFTTQLDLGPECGLFILLRTHSWNSFTLLPILRSSVVAAIKSSQDRVGAYDQSLLYACMKSKNIQFIRMYNFFKKELLRCGHGSLYKLEGLLGPERCPNSQPVTDTSL